MRKRMRKKTLLLSEEEEEKAKAVMGESAFPLCGRSHPLERRQEMGGLAGGRDVVSNLESAHERCIPKEPHQEIMWRRI
jgi:hypothetical protein